MTPAELAAWCACAAEAFSVAGVPPGSTSVVDRDAAVIEYTVHCLADASISDTGPVLELIDRARAVN